MFEPASKSVPNPKTLLKRHSATRVEKLQIRRGRGYWERRSSDSNATDAAGTGTNLIASQKASFALATSEVTEQEAVVEPRGALTVSRLSVVAAYRAQRKTNDVESSLLEQV